MQVMAAKQWLHLPERGLRIKKQQTHASEEVHALAVAELTVVDTERLQHGLHPLNLRTGTDTSNRHRHVQQAPTRPTGTDTSNRHQHVQQAPTRPTGTDTSNRHRHVQQAPTRPTGTDTSNRHRHVQQAPTRPTGTDTSNRHRHVQQVVILSW